MRTVGFIGLLALAPLALTGCSTVAYSVQEKFGIEKRDILVDRVEDAAESQNEAKAEFADALEAFRAVVNVDGGEIETTYDDLKRAYDRADGKADATRSRVASV
jgi:predicted aminopeptidase